MNIELHLKSASGSENKKIEIRTLSIPLDILQRLQETARCWKYSSLESIFHVVCIDIDHWCGVAGDGGNGCYEWFVFSEGRLVTSDCGYGDTAIALLDVMNQEVSR